MLRKCLRTLQNGFPGLGEAKNEFYHWSRSRFGLLHDSAFAVIGRLPRRDDDLFLDVGANRGQSILSLRKMRPDAAIVSFEPNPAMVRWLRRHFTEDAGWRLEPFGLGAMADRRPLFTPRYAGFAYDGLATFSAEAARAFLSSDTLFGFDPRRLTIDEDVCETRTLDSLNIRPTFIKVDVEGLEHEVLQGGAATIRACEPVLMVERFHRNPALMPLIAALGYVEVKPDGRTFARGATTGENMFCMTPRTLAAIQKTALEADDLQPRTRLATAR
jgi:FkbM family methyltransferase